MVSEKPSNWQELGDEFHLMIGNCIAAWAEVDDELFRIFRDCVGPYEQCAIVYYRMPGLDVRLGCTSELVESVFPKPERRSGGHPHESVKRWRKVQGTFLDLLSVRRRIAHQPVGVRMSFPKRLVHLKSLNKTALERYGLGADSWLEIYMSERERVRAGKEIPGLDLNALKTHLSDVVRLRDSLRDFFFAHLAKIAPDAKPSRPEIQPLLAKLKPKNSGTQLPK
jgi:hypothetical protein